MIKKLNYWLEFTSAVGVFSGLSVAGLVDRMVTRDANGLPVIPGSTVKGRWRYWAERVARGNGGPHGLRVHDVSDEHGHNECRDREHACAVCRIFGNPSLPSALYVGQANLIDPGPVSELLAINPNPVVHPDTELRPGLARSRMRRTALPMHLHFDEVVPALQFQGELRLMKDIKGAEFDLLRLSALLVDALGARKAAGRGSLAAERDSLAGGIQVEWGASA